MYRYSGCIPAVVADIFKIDELQGAVLPHENVIFLQVVVAKDNVCRTRLAQQSQDRRNGHNTSTNIARFNCGRRLAFSSARQKSRGEEGADLSWSGTLKRRDINAMSLLMSRAMT